MKKLLAVPLLFLMSLFWMPFASADISFGYHDPPQQYTVSVIEPTVDQVSLRSTDLKYLTTYDNSLVSSIGGVGSIYLPNIIGADYIAYRRHFEVGWKAA